MRTTKPIATISFNSPAFLKLKLEELTKAGKISFWAFIPHKPEDDEAGTKEHNHLYAEPSKMMQTDDLKAELLEFDPEHPDKPKGCLPFRTSSLRTGICTDCTISGTWHQKDSHGDFIISTKR